METGSQSKSKWPCPVDKTMKYIGQSNGMEWYISKIFPVTAQIVIKGNILERTKVLYKFSQVYLYKQMTMFTR